MPSIDLQKLATRESEQVEWTENVADPADVVKTIVAFANDLANLGGGYVVCGARESRDEQGFQTVAMVGLTSAQYQEVEGAVMNGCREQVSPPLAPIVEELPTGDPEKRVLVFVVPASRQAHAFRTAAGTGKYYVRLSRKIGEARNGLYRQLLLQKGEVEPWDRRASRTATVADLDLVALRDALQQMGLFDPSRGIQDYLSDTSSLGPFVPPLCVRDPVTDTLRPRNFAVLLFCRELQRHVAGAYSLFSRYPGLDRSEPHASRHELAGSLLSQIRRLDELLEAAAYTMFDKNDPGAPNAVKYPARALYEAMVNALAHRDYERDGPCRITVFSDRIEVVSPGPLVPGLSIEQLQQGSAGAIWRNQSLAWFLNRLQLAQAEGQGVPTIVQTMRDEGCPPPRFEATADMVRVQLPAHPRHVVVGVVRDAVQKVSFGTFMSALLPIVEFMERHEAGLEPIELLAVVELGEALLALRQPSSTTWQVVRRLLPIVARRGDEQEVQRMVSSLRAARQEGEAQRFLDAWRREHPPR